MADNEGPAAGLWVDNEVYQEYRVTCPCGDVVYIGRNLFAAVRAYESNYDDRYHDELNRMEVRTVLPWKLVPASVPESLAGASVVQRSE